MYFSCTFQFYGCFHTTEEEGRHPRNVCLLPPEPFRVFWAYHFSATSYFTRIVTTTLQSFLRFWWTYISDIGAVLCCAVLCCAVLCSVFDLFWEQADKVILKGREEGLYFQQCFSDVSNLTKTSGKLRTFVE